MPAKSIDAPPPSMSDAPPWPSPATAAAVPSPSTMLLAEPLAETILVPAPDAIDGRRPMSGRYCRRPPPSRSPRRRPGRWRCRRCPVRRSRGPVRAMVSRGASASPHRWTVHAVGLLGIDWRARRGGFTAARVLARGVDRFGSKVDQVPRGDQRHHHSILRKSYSRRARATILWNRLNLRGRTKNVDWNWRALVDSNHRPTA